MKTKEEINKDLREQGINPEDYKPSWQYMKYLKDPDIFDKITEKELDKKIVGEIQTRKVIFLCAFGGKLIENSQIASYNLLVNDDAGTGKDYVIEKVLEFLSNDDYIHKTRISPTVFTYWHNAKYEPEWTWNGKVFYTEDISETVLNSDVFKVMCSSGTSATITIHNQAIDVEIQGKPVMITTTASAVPNPELIRRFVILNLDSSEKQTKAIMKRHSEFKMKGIVPEYDPVIKEALKYLCRVKVRIPYCDLIDGFFPSKNVIMRTHYPRFLDFICASAGFHQFQREKDKKSFILATGKDYDIARECFLKLTSNKYMIPLTINQKKILELFEKNTSLSGTATDLHTNKGMNFISEKALITNLSLLSRYGILDSHSEEINGRERTIYLLCSGYKPNEKIEIPTFEELCRNSSVGIIDKIGIIDTVGINTNNTINTQKVPDFDEKPEVEVIKPDKNIDSEKASNMSKNDTLDTLGKEELTSITMNKEYSRNSLNTSNTEVNELNELFPLKRFIPQNEQNDFSEVEVIKPEKLDFSDLNKVIKKILENE